MKKNLSRLIDIMGDIITAGIGTVIMYLGGKIIKWSFSELDNSFKK